MKNLVEKLLKPSDCDRFVKVAMWCDLHLEYIKNHNNDPAVNNIFKHFIYESIIEALYGEDMLKWIEKQTKNI